MRPSLVGKATTLLRACSCVWAGVGPKLVAVIGSSQGPVVAHQALLPGGFAHGIGLSWVCSLRWLLPAHWVWRLGFSSGSFVVVLISKSLGCCFSSGNSPFHFQARSRARRLPLPICCRRHHKVMRDGADGDGRDAVCCRSPVRAVAPLSRTCPRFLFSSRPSACLRMSKPTDQTPQASHPRARCALEGPHPTAT